MKNMEKLCKFTDIEQYRQIVQYIKSRTQYVGKDEDGNAIFDENILLPSISFRGTTKIHGTNSSVSLTKDGFLYPQSREQILSITEDNAGFALFFEKNKKVFHDMLSSIDMKDFDYVSIFGEWCGKGIQKGMAITQLEKLFVIFDIKLSYENNTKGENVYLSEEEISKLRSTENRIFNIYDYQIYNIEIDFNKPQEALDKLIELTNSVENECPVGKAFGVSGLGEGIVWTHISKTGEKIRFKTKGEKHKVTKSKDTKIVDVDVEKINSVNDFVEYTVTEPRLNQGIEKVFGFNQPLDIKKTGDFLRWIVQDIMKEEIDTLIQNGLEPKDVNSSISNKARIWFFNKLNEF